MQAAQAYLLQNTFADLPAASILIGIDNDDLTVPRAVLTCKDAQASELIYEGLWNLDLDITLTSHANDSTGAEHHALAGEVFARFMTASIADDLSAALADFSVQQVVPRGQSWDTDGNTWKSTFKIGLLNACGSDVG